MSDKRKLGCCGAEESDEINNAESWKKGKCPVCGFQYARPLTPEEMANDSSPDSEQTLGGVRLKDVEPAVKENIL